MPNVNTARLATLLQSLDEAIETVAESRRPDPVHVAAFDTLKQARALVAQAYAREAEDLADEAADPCVEFLNSPVFVVD